MQNMHGTESIYEMDSTANKKEVGRNIYYMTADVFYKKKKNRHRYDAWIVTRYETPGEIMAHDKKTMSRLNSEIYGATYKGERHILIRNIKTKKVVGTANPNPNE